jgi:hypothetical protein
MAGSIGRDSAQIHDRKTITHAHRAKADSGTSSVILTFDLPQGPVQTTSP